MGQNSQLSVGTGVIANKTKKTNNNLHIVKRYKFFYLMLLPVVVWYIVFCYVPMYGIITAFQNYIMHKGTFASEFVGLTHFRTLIHDMDFWRVFRNSAVIASYRIIFEFPIPIILAILLNEIRQSWLRKSIQTIVYLPHFLSWVIVASIIVSVFNPDKIGRASWWVKVYK